MYDYGYNELMGNTSADLVDSMIASTAIMVIISLLITITISILMTISLWKIYKKAGKPGWASIVPIYNIIVLLEICELPLWYIALMFIPFANIYATIKTYIELAHKFGKSTVFGVVSIFFPMICMPILAFSKNAVYTNGTNENAVNNSYQPQINNVNSNNNGMNYNQNVSTYSQPEVISTPMAYENNMIGNNLQAPVEAPMQPQMPATNVMPVQPGELLTPQPVNNIQNINQIPTQNVSQENIVFGQQTNPMQNNNQNGGMM